MGATLSRVFRYSRAAPKELPLNTTPTCPVLTIEVPDKNINSFAAVQKSVRLLERLHNPNSSQHRSSTRTFTPFPRLPTELRLKIWKRSLPQGHKGERMIPVTTSSQPRNPILILPQMNPHCISFCSDTFDIGLSRACDESRKIYLQKNQSILPLGSKSLLRFDAKNDIIFILNFGNIIDTFFDRPPSNKFTVLKHITEVENLAIPIGFHGAYSPAPVLASFGKLRRLITVMTCNKDELQDMGFDRDDENPDSAETIRWNMWLSIRKAKERMKRYKQNYDRAYQLPQLLLLDQGQFYEMPVEPAKQ